MDPQEKFKVRKFHFISYSYIHNCAAKKVAVEEVFSNSLGDSTVHIYRSHTESLHLPAYSRTRSAIKSAVQHPVMDRNYA